MQMEGNKAAWRGGPRGVLLNAPPIAVRKPAEEGRSRLSKPLTQFLELDVFNSNNKYEWQGAEVERAVLSPSLKQLLEGASQRLQCSGLGGIWVCFEGFCFWGGQGRYLFI